MATYGFRKEKDINPNSPTFGQVRWVRDSSYDATCNPHDTTPNWEDTGQTACSTSETIFVQGEGGEFAFKRQRDINEHSATYNWARWVRDENNDSSCGTAPVIPDADIYFSGTVDLTICQHENIYLNGALVGANDYPPGTIISFLPSTVSSAVVGTTSVTATVTFPDSSVGTDTFNVTVIARRKITVSIPNGGGTFVSDTGLVVGTNYACEGELVRILNVVPNQGFEFEHIKVNGSEVPGTDYTFVVSNQDVDIEIYFEEVVQKYRWSAEVCPISAGKGTVVAVPSSGIYNNGTSVQAEAVPNNGFVFDKWIRPNGQVFAYSNPLSRIINGAKIEVCAVFKEIPDEAPDWQETGVVKCSSSDSMYIPIIGGENPYAFKEMIDTNPYSPLYNTKYWERDEPSDGQCTTQDNYEFSHGGDINIDCSTCTGVTTITSKKNGNNVSYEVVESPPWVTDVSIQNEGVVVTTDCNTPTEDVYEFTTGSPLEIQCNTSMGMAPVTSTKNGEFQEYIVIGQPSWITAVHTLTDKVEAHAEPWENPDVYAFGATDEVEVPCSTNTIQIPITSTKNGITQEFTIESMPSWVTVNKIGNNIQINAT